MAKRKGKKPHQGKPARTPGGAVPPANRGRTQGDAPDDWDPNAPVVLLNRYVPVAQQEEAVHDGTSVSGVQGVYPEYGRAEPDTTAVYEQAAHMIEQGTTPLANAADTHGADQLQWDARQGVRPSPEHAQPTVYERMAPVGITRRQVDAARKAGAEAVQAALPDPADMGDDARQGVRSMGTHGLPDDQQMMGRQVPPGYPRKRTSWQALDDTDEALRTARGVGVATEHLRDPRRSAEGVLDGSAEAYGSAAQQAARFDAAVAAEQAEALDAISAAGLDGTATAHSGEPEESARLAVQGRWARSPVNDLVLNTGPLLAPDGKPVDSRRVTAYAEALRGQGVGTHGASPPVRTPADVAALRTWLVEQWRPGRPYAISSEYLAGPGRTDGGPRNSPGSYARAEMVMLQRASLWHVAPSMVDLLATVAPSTPGDVCWHDLPEHGDCGLVVFAKPLAGTDSDDADNRIWIDAIVWGHSALPAFKGRKPLRALTISSYRCVDFAEGLDGTELRLAHAVGALAYGVAQPAEPLPDGTLPDAGTHGVQDGALAFHVAGTTWMPLGRSDWPYGDGIDTPVWPDQQPASVASYAEDRRLVAALWTLLEQRGVAARTSVTPPRPVRRRAERAGVAAPASDVVVVTLRNPRREADPDRVPGEAPKRSHRWMVKEHLRWQACGPGRTERRLTLVHAHIKGPADAPLVMKTKVNAWVR